MTWLYPLCILFLQFFISPLLLQTNRKIFIESEIYYNPPSFDIKNTNVTFGIARPITFAEESTQSVSETLVSICQAELINKKKAQISIDGIINLVFQDYSDYRTSGEEAMLGLLSNNLFYYSNNSRVNENYAVNLTGFLSVSSFGTAKINSLTTNSFGMPFISSSDLGRPSQDNQFSGGFPGQNVTFAQILNTFKFNSFNAVLEILKHFNWTLVANIFQANTYGYNRQQSVLDYSSQNSSPKFTCGFVYGAPELSGRDDGRAINDFCQCVQSKDKISVIVLWMSTSSAYFAVKSLKENCSAAKKCTFIVADDVQSPTNLAGDFSVLNNSLLVRNNGPWDFKSFINNCHEYASPESKKTIDSVLNDFFLRFYNCQYKKAEGIPICPETLVERDGLCSCTLNEVTKDPYVTKFFYTADALNVYAAAISLIQNNCTFLNDNRNISKLTTLLPDFCSLTRFGPPELSYATRFVDFTGYTGVINFSQEVLIRKIKPFYLYSVFNTSIDATLVGYMNQTGTEIYNNLISFVDDEVPVSKIVPQNPDLSYAVVDVFFGVSIIELIICLALLVFFIYHLNNRVIRQCAPLVTITLLIGVTGMAIAELLLSFARTSTWCTINFYFFRTSLNLILMSLLVKNYRVYRIFANKKATAVFITENTLLMYIGISTLVFLILLTVIVAVFGFEAVIRQSSSNIFYQYVQCTLPNKAWNQIVQISLDVFIYLQVIASLILAWLTRKVQAEYRESKGLAAFAITLFVSLLIFIPLNYTLGDETDSQILRYVIVVEFFTITIISAFGLLFVPIVLSVYAQRKEDKGRNYRSSSSNNNNNYRYT